MARRFYTDSEKILACEIIARYGGEVTKEAIVSVREALEAPRLNKSTIHRWVQSQPGATQLQPVKKAAAQIVNQKLDDMFEDAARRLLEHAAQPDKIKELDSRQAMLAAAIAVDKMRLLRDMPTEIIKLWPGFVEAAEALGRTPADVFNAFIQQTAALKAQRGENDDADRYPSGGSA